MGQQSRKISGNRDQPRHTSMQLAPYLGRDRQTVHLGKMKVEERHVILILEQGLESLLAICGDVDVMTTLREEQLQDFMSRRAVFRDQDLAAHNRV
jgi:hypothetical protein